MIPNAKATSDSGIANGKMPSSFPYLGYVTLRYQKYFDLSLAERPIVVLLSVP